MCSEKAAKTQQSSTRARSEQNSDTPTSLKHTQATKWLLTFKGRKIQTDKDFVPFEKVASGSDSFPLSI